MWIVLFGMKEIDTLRYKDGKIQERCQYEMISNLQPDHLLCLTEMNENNSDQSTNSYVQSFDGTVETVERSMDRRHPLVVSLVVHCATYRGPTNGATRRLVKSPSRGKGQARADERSAHCLWNK